MKEHTSGAANNGVPKQLMLAVLTETLVNPKSEIFALISCNSVLNDTTSKLSGFRSRWMILLE